MAGSAAKKPVVLNAVAGLEVRLLVLLVVVRAVFAGC
jgi:hypothetical protein